MSVKFRKVQNKIESSKAFNKWYGRIVYTDTVTTDQLAALIEANCTVKRADVLAVLSELSVVIKNELANSHRVEINDLGTFKLGLKSIGQEKEDDFTANSITGAKVMFVPITHRINGHYVKDMTAQCRFAEHKRFEPKETSGGSGSGSGEGSGDERP